MLKNRYLHALSQIPSPGSGCHVALLGAANLGILANVPPEQILLDIRQNIPEGSRRVPDREITDAINRALSDHKSGAFIPQAKPEPVTNEGQEALQRLIGSSDISDEADLFELSPIRLADAADDTTLFLQTVFRQIECIFIGDRLSPGILGSTIRTREEWLEHFQIGQPQEGFVIVNPLTGEPAAKETGDGETYRGNRNISAYRYCLVEFDNLSFADQIRFWAAIRLPVVALIDSGNKSIHAWLDVQKLASVNNHDDWQVEIKSHLYGRVLSCLGVDTACSNPARLSRLPGVFRRETGKFQKLLWLSPEGRPICQ